MRTDCATSLHTVINWASFFSLHCSSINSIVDFQRARCASFLWLTRLESKRVICLTSRRISFPMCCCHAQKGLTEFMSRNLRHFLAISQYQEQNLSTNPKANFNAMCLYLNHCIRQKKKREQTGATKNGRCVDEFQMKHSKLRNARNASI